MGDEVRLLKEMVRQINILCKRASEGMTGAEYNELEANIGLLVWVCKSVVVQALEREIVRLEQGE